MADPSEALWNEVARFDSDVPIERAWMPPSSWYRDPAFLELERRAVPWPSWQPVCRVTEVSDPGHYLAGCHNGLPFVVVRDEESLWAEWGRCAPSAVFLALGNDTSRPSLCREAVTRFPDSTTPILVAIRQLSDALIQSAYAAGAADVVGVPVRWATTLPRLERP